jgi:RNA polymerase sigma factor (sigma-70 family)
MNGSDGSENSTTTLYGDEAALFAEHHDRLIRSVSRAVRTSQANIEDACSFAWMQLLRHQPERREELFAWLRTVAIREAIRLDRAQLRSAPMVDLDEPTTEVCRSEVLDALQAVADLSPRLQRIFALHIAGYSYEEISYQTGDTARTVDRLMARARSRVRR